MTAPHDPHVIASRAARGAVAIGARQAVVIGVNVAGGVLLARWMTPAEFGMYGVLVFVMGFLTVFGDVGLGASLVRQPNEPTPADFRSIFAVQSVLVGLIVTAAWWAAPAVVSAYARPPGEVWAIRLTAVALVFSSLRSIAAIPLERSLRFGKLAAVEVMQAVTFNGLAVGFVAAGHGPMGVAIALLARSAVGALLVNVVSRWPFGLAWDTRRIRSHLAFGLPYQGIHVVSLLKDSITPLLIGMLLGAAAVGNVRWALMVASYPVLVVAPLSRLYLPTFSRLQHDPAALGIFVERVLRVTNLIVAPLAAITVALVVPLTEVVFGEKWLPALPLFYLLWAAQLLVPISAPLLGLLNALGRSRVAFGFALLWAAGTWVLGVPMILAWGAIGYAIANVLLQASVALLVLTAKKLVPFRVGPAVRAAWSAAIVGGVSVQLIVGACAPTDLVGLALSACLGVVVYGTCVLAMNPAGARRALAWFRRELNMPRSSP